MNIGVDIDGVLTDLERMALDFGTKMCVEENIPIELNLSKYWEIEKEKRKISSRKSYNDRVEYQKEYRKANKKKIREKLKEDLDIE